MSVNIDELEAGLNGADEPYSVATDEVIRVLIVEVRRLTELLDIAEAALEHLSIYTVECHKDMEESCWGRDHSPAMMIIARDALDEIGEGRK